MCIIMTNYTPSADWVSISILSLSYIQGTP